MRTRIDTALNRGRCGLWDWDLARGRIFWSHSMFEILGLDTKYDLLSFGDVDALVHPDDVRLYQLAAELADATTTTIDHVHASRRRPLGYGCAHDGWSVSQEPGLHLIGIASTSPNRNLVRKLSRPIYDCATRLRRFPRLSFYGTPKIVLCCATRIFRSSTA